MIITTELVGGPLDGKRLHFPGFSLLDATVLIDGIAYAYEAEKGAVGRLRFLGRLEDSFDDWDESEAVS